MGHFGYKLPEGLVGEISTTGINVIRTYIAKTDIVYGELVQIDHLSPSDTQLILPFETAISGVFRPVLGIAVRNARETPGGETDRYVAGDLVSVMTYGDTRVHIDIGDEAWSGMQIYLVDRQGATEPGRSAYTFAPVTDNTLLPNDALETYGVMIDGGVPTTENTFRINFNPFSVVAVTTV